MANDGMIWDIMWVKQFHKSFPSHHHLYRWYGYPFPVMDGLWHFNHITQIWIGYFLTTISHPSKFPRISALHPLLLLPTCPPGTSTFFPATSFPKPVPARAAFHRDPPNLINLEWDQQSQAVTSHWRLHFFWARSSRESWNISKHEDRRVFQIHPAMCNMSVQKCQGNQGA